MKLVFFSNYLNHHQVVLADAFYEILGDDYRFVATCPLDVNELKGGEDYTSRPYCICAADQESDHLKALELAKESDVCVFGACSQEYAVSRAQHNSSGLSFEMGERWLKRGWINILSPVLLRWLVNYRRYYRKANFHKLCMNAFASCDDEKLGCYKGRHYKWGYFSETNSSRKTRLLFDKEPIQILWCARFLKLKHPELVIYLMERLKKRNLSARLCLIGSGEELEHTKDLADRLGVSNLVSFLGNKPNNEVRTYMAESDIMIFSSDKNEGWGVVANEAMSEGCLLIASDEIGSVPFLVKDGVNGLIFKSNNVDSLEAKVMQVVADKESARQMAAEGKRTLDEVWSAKNAAVSMLRLIDDLKGGNVSTINEGPCSRA